MHVLSRIVRGRSVTILAVGALLIGACEQSPPPPTSPTSPDPTIAGTPDIGGGIIAQEDQFETTSRRVSRAVPEFGGAFVDSDGVLTIYVTSIARGPAAREALLAELQKSGREVASTKLRMGRFGFGQLWTWYTAMRSTLTMPGVVSNGIDERANQLRIGITSPSARSPLEQVIAKTGIPADAVVIELTSAPVALATLRDRIYPWRGGTQITGIWNGGSGICTFGLNVRNMNDPSNPYMVTNSHCTQSPPVTGGINNPVQIWQPTTSGLITFLAGAPEAADPPFVSGGTCPAGAFCRYSDASLIKVQSNNALGVIARPVGRNFLPTIYGSITIDGANPTFTLSGSVGVFAGDTVEKVGRTTGWTAGVVTSTCTDVNISGYIRQCSSVVSAGAGRGDSGSPVFWRNNNTGRYFIGGLLYGGILNFDGQSGDTYYFSNWNFVSLELAGAAGLAPN